MGKKTVVVGLSGGVDSSVSAYLLKEAGYDVKGLFMKNWQSEPGEVCTSEIDFKDASKVCDKLNIPLHKANFSDEYWDRVFTNFLSEHEKGRTPNPDVLCNREIKFKSFLDYAFEIGADFIATGHYAKIINKDGRKFLARAKDINKDQTYFLHEVSEKEFSKCLFPLENLTKLEVRNIASNDLGSAVLEKDPELKEPPLYQVILINDDYTPMEFVVYVLQTVFNHTHEKSTQIMMAVHTKGKGVCGIFSKEIAEMMSYEVNNMAKHHNHPLLSEIEPLTD